MSFNVVLQSVLNISFITNIKASVTDENITKAIYADFPFLDSCLNVYIAIHRTSKWTNF